MPDMVALVVYALATARLSSMLPQDLIFNDLKVTLLRRLMPDDDTEDAEDVTASWWRKKLAELIMCVWCQSIWIGAATAIATCAVTGWGYVHAPALALAFSQVAGMLSDLGRGD